MSIVLNSAKLAFLISIVITYLFGQGWLIFKLVSHERMENWSLLQMIALTLTCGLIANLGIILIFQDLKIALIIGCGISAVGIYYAIHDIRLVWPRITFSRKSALIWFGAILLCLLYLSPILVNPLKDWDARSIWFFHAKMIFTADSVGQSAGWQDLSPLTFSHPDYPILIPVLASQIATVAGFWNEFLPKLSLLFLLVPAVLWLFTFAQKSISFAILVLFLPFAFSRWMWNGYMDGYLALYFSMALLLLGRYLLSNDLTDLLSSLSCLILLLYIKNEGTLAMLTGMCALLLVLFFQRKVVFRDVFKINWKYFLAGAIVLLPFLLWTIYKWHWNISNDLEIGSMQSIHRLIGRITDGSYRYLLKNVYRRIEGILLLLLLLYGACFSRRMFPKESLPALLAAGAYCLGMFVIYLSTPYTLKWHVSTSLDRTMLSVNAGLFVVCYFILRALESKSVADTSNITSTINLKEESSPYL